MNPVTPMRRIRSFVCRNSRLSEAQENALTSLWPTLGITLQAAKKLPFADLFKNAQETYLEIGFGTGHSLLAAAQQFPDKNFIGIETHLPGIGSLILGIEKFKLENIRIINADAVEVLSNHIEEGSLAGVKIFFSDPWPKRKHHKRRLIQENFINLICQKIKSTGSLHLATDWQHYAMQMMQVLTAQKELKNSVGINQYSSRSPFRPIVSRFEQRAIKEGRNIWDLQFIRL